MGADRRSRAMLVKIRANTTRTPAPSALSALAGREVPCCEFKYRERVEIFGEAEPAEYVYQIREGAVRTYKLLSDGRRQIGAFHLPGDIFGVENGDLHRFTAEAIVNTTVWIAKRRSLFGASAEENIPTKRKVRELVTRSLEHAENHLLILGRQTALEKVAAFLIEMDRRLEKPKEMILPMTCRDIADYLGLTLETVSRALSILRHESVLSFLGKTQRNIVLHDRPKLIQLALSPQA